MVPRWYVVQTKVNQETVACENLQRQGYTIYFPQQKSARRRKGKWIFLTEPLFPRYLFIQLTEGEDSFSPIRSTVGVLKLIQFGKQPASITNEVIEAIKKQELISRHDLTDGQLPWKPGDKLNVVDGPFAGLVGIYEKQEAERVVILMDILGRQNRILISSDKLAPHR